jgi:hypothetical protein
MSRSDVPFLDEDKQEGRFLDSGYIAPPRYTVLPHIISLFAQLSTKRFNQLSFHLPLNVLRCLTDLCTVSPSLVFPLTGAT